MPTPLPAYGVATPQQLAGLSGRQALQAMIDGTLPQSPICATLGFLLVAVDDGVAVFEGTPSAALFNPLGTVHGGWALTLIDSATGCAAHTTLPAGAGYTTVETKANFSRGITATTGVVRCEGRVVSAGRRIISAQAVLRDAGGRVLAHGTSTLMVLAPGG